MCYIIYDLEFNQKEKNIEIDEHSRNNLSFEIIQIGAIKISKDLEFISSFSSLVKPTVFKTIHPYIQELTKITDSTVVNAPTFPYVYSKFLDFIGNEDSILCVWGQADIRELYRNLQFHNIPTSTLPSKYIDIQLHASNHFKAPLGSRIGLRNAIELLNLPIQNAFHDATNDAMYTAEIFRKIFDDKFIALEYKPIQRNIVKKEKETVDFSRVINQFEKMYNRKMTAEEKEIIKLSYFMGKTKQFIR